MLLLHQYLNRLQEQLPKRHLGFHQRYLILLSDRLFSFRNRNAPEYADSEARAHGILEEIEHILKQLEWYAGRLLDGSLTVPLFHQERLLHANPVCCASLHGI